MQSWTEDTVAILLGIIILGLAIVVYLFIPFDQVRESYQSSVQMPAFDAREWVNQTDVRNTAGEYLSEVVNDARPARWQSNPAASLLNFEFVLGLIAFLILMLIFFGTGTYLLGHSVAAFSKGFCFIVLLGVFAYLLANQADFRSIGLGYALWAIVLGLAVSNIFGIPEFVRPALQPELYIKTGLVLLGAEVLFGKILAIGLPGIFVAWIVTPVVLISTYWFGQKILNIGSKTLNITISADMSVCGVSAAIATAAACKASKEELTTAVGLSMIFTSVMMVALPAFINAVGMPEVLGGAWIGGTIDATGAVVAAGAFLGDTALNVAATIKMIQNILIGVLAFGVAMYWTAKVDKTGAQQVGISEIWIRFPKFVLGFLGASIFFSLLYEYLNDDIAIVLIENGVLDFTSDMRGWLFCLAFASIGLSANFKALKAQFHGGKPLILYFCGQSLNLCLTLLMAWIMFYKVFPDITNNL